MVTRKTAAIAVSIILLLVIALGLGVPLANSATSNPEPYITEKSCSMYNTCQEPQRCFHVSESYGSDARCVEPGYAENYCGIFELTAVKASLPAEATCSQNIIGGIFLNILP
ncbi:MAG: hypothetical protein BRC29_05170 [Nanohaloarchaea archaeon SW_7_43_1]|nr:MAG: hypothetical protein BRC29_05170 [Nanohaloarchaea archaeon SW_7_43_1]